jgi:hypothetical protein
MARDPSALPSYQTWDSGTAAPPTGMQNGIWSGEVGWAEKNDGTIGPTAGSWRATGTTSSFTRGATEGGFRVKVSTLPSNGNLFFVFLVTNPAASSPTGYNIRWEVGTDFQLQKYTAGSATFLDGDDQVNVSGTVAAGFELAIIADNSGVEIFVSTNGGSSWQSMGVSTDTAHTGSLYGGLETNGGTSVRVTTAWLGQQTAGGVTITAVPASLTASAAAPAAGHAVVSPGATVTPSAPAQVISHTLTSPAALLTGSAGAGISISDVLTLLAAADLQLPGTAPVVVAAQTVTVPAAAMVTLDVGSITAGKAVVTPPASLAVSAAAAQETSIAAPAALLTLGAAAPGLFDTQVAPSATLTVSAPTPDKQAQVTITAVPADLGLSAAAPTREVRVIAPSSTLTLEVPLPTLIGSTSEVTEAARDLTWLLRRRKRPDL